MKYIIIFFIVVASLFCGYRAGVYYSGLGVQGALSFAQGNAAFKNLTELEKLKDEFKNNCMESANVRLEWMMDKQVRLLNALVSSDESSALDKLIKGKSASLYGVILSYDPKKNKVWVVPACE